MLSLQVQRVCSEAVAETGNFFRRRVVEPVWQLLRIGATPERLAWSIAVGAVIGVNPLLGSTTLLTVAAATGFRLNLVASQLGNHVVYALEMLLLPVFMRLGSVLFRTAAMPMGLGEMMRAAKVHPWSTTVLLWRWEWHALVVWAMFAVVALPVLQWALKVVLARMLVQLLDEPVIEK